MQISLRQQRLVVRVLHLLFGAVLGALVYAPSGMVDTLRGGVQVGVFPLLTLTGLWLWLGPRLKRLMRADQGHRRVLPKRAA